MWSVASNLETKQIDLFLAVWPINCWKFLSKGRFNKFTIVDCQKKNKFIIVKKIQIIRRTNQMIQIFCY